MSKIFYCITRIDPCPFDLFGQDVYGDTPLHYAVSSGHTEIAELLIDAGADLEAKNPAVGTPLLFAVLQGHKEVVELLIAEGADVNAKDIADRTPVDVAIRYKLTEIADLLRKHGGKTGEELKAEGK